MAHTRNALLIRIRPIAHRSGLPIKALPYWLLMVAELLVLAPNGNARFTSISQPLFFKIKLMPYTQLPQITPN